MPRPERSDVAYVQIDGMVASARRQLPEQWFGDFADKAGKLRGTLISLDDAIEKVHISGKYSADGVRTEVRELLEKVMTHHRTTRREWLGKTDEALAAARAAAVRPPTAVDPMLRELRDREIRDRLVGVDSTQINVLLAQAALRGDHDLVRAVENAPRAFPLASVDAIDKTKKQLMARIDPAIELLEGRRELFEILLGAADEHLRGIARREGIDFSSPERDFKRPDGTPFPLGAPA